MGISLVLTVILLNVALGLLRFIGEPFDRVFNAQKASEILLLIDTRTEDQDQIANWFLDQDEVLQVSEPSPYLMISPPLIHGEKEIDFSIQLTEYNRGHKEQDELRILKGALQEHPDYGEIWLPSHFEGSYGLQLGDSLGFTINGELRELKISAFVVDPHYLSALFNPSRAWVAPGALSLLAPISELNTVMVGVRLKNGNELATIWERFSEAHNFSGKSLQYPLFKSVYMSFYSLLSSVLLVFAIMGILISLLIIRHTLSAHIFSDYKQIGILKGLGFTPSNMVSLYLMQMGFVSVVVLPMGLTISWWVLHFLINWITEPLGIPSTSFDFGGTMVLSFGVVVVLVLTVSFFSARRAGLIKPVEAICNAAGEMKLSGRKNSTAFTSHWIPLNMLLGGRFLNSKRKNLVFMTINMIGIVFVLVFCINISNSFGKIHLDRTAWGFDNSDLIVNRNGALLLALKHDQLMEMLEAHDEIRTVAAHSYTSLSILSKNDKAIKEIQGKVYTCPLAETGLGNIVGNHPKAQNEISLCIGTAKEFNKGPDDKIITFIEGQKKEFIISGIYQDVGNLGQGFRIQEETLLQLNPLFEPQLYGVQLEPDVNKEVFRSRLENKFGETIQIESSIEERASMVSLVMNIRIAVLIVSLFFVMVLVLIIYTDQNIFVQQNKTSFVKLKSLGFSNKKLKTIMLWKTTLNLAFAIMAGIPLSLWLGPVLMNMLTADIGLARFPFLPYPMGMALSIFTLLALGGLSAWFAASAIKKIDFRVMSSI